MRTYLRLLFPLATFAGLLTACGSSAGLPSVTPSVAISSPSSNSTVNLSASKEIAIGFNTNYTIKAPGTCAGADTCGHLYVLVDNSSCNTPSLPYNTLASSSPTSANLGLCAMATGMHTIIMELHHDDGTVVNTLLGTPVKTQVTITAQ